VCSGHDGFVCLGVTMSERNGVVLAMHHTTDPETKRRWGRALEILRDIAHASARVEGAS